MKNNMTHGRGRSLVPTLLWCGLTLSLSGCGPAIHALVAVVGGTSGGFAASQGGGGDAAVDGAPSLDTNQDLVVAEGSTNNTITNQQLQVSDDTGSEVTFTLTSLPARGALRQGSQVLAANDTFTQAQIDSGLLAYDHDGSELGFDSFDFSAADSGGNQIIGTFQITITPVNDPLVLVNNNTLTLNEAAASAVLTGNLQFADVDNAPPQIRYLIASAPINGALLRNGVPLLSGQAFTQAQIDAGAITYQHDGGETIADSFVVTASDGSVTLPALTFNIIVNPINDNPILVRNQTLTVGEGASNTITSALLLSTDDDNADAGLIYTLTVAPVNGTLFNNGAPLGASSTFLQGDINNNQLTYTHDGGETISDSFQFQVSDGLGGVISDTAFTIAVTAQNNPPVLVNNNPLTVDEGALNQTIGNGLLLSSDADTPPNQVRYTINPNTANGTLRLGVTALAANDTFSQQDINAGLVTYSHDGSETTSDSFSFTVSDGLATLPTAAFSIVVNPVNDAPVLVNNNPLTVDEGALDQAIGNDLLLVSDPDNLASELTFTLTIAPANGSLENNNTALVAGQTFTQANINAGLLTYSHDGSETTSDSFQFQVSDGAGGSIPATIFSIVVNAINDAPVLVNNGGLTVDEGAQDQLIGNDLLLVTDADNLATQLTYTLVSAPINGSLMRGVTALAANDTFTQQDIDGGNLSYSHDGSETISDSFSFTLSDGAGGSIPETTFSIVVNPVNDAPVLVNNNPLTVDEGAQDQPIGNDLLLVTDADNLASELTYTLMAAPANGSLELNNAALTVGQTFTQADINAALLTYSHDGGETTSDSFQFQVSDGAGGSIPTTTFSIVVNPVNDNPILVNNGGLTVNEGALNRIINTGFLQVTDADNLASQLTYTLVSAPINGSLMRGVTALAANDTFTQQDIDGGNLSYSHDGSETISDSFSFTVSDGAGGSIPETTFSIVISAQNDAPFLVNNGGLTVDEGALDQIIASAALLVSDVDTAPTALTYTLITAPINGSLERDNTALAANDTFTQQDINDNLLAYSHDGSETTSDSFSFTVSDGAGGSIPETTFSIVVNPVNDAPVLVNNNPLTVDEGALNQIVGNDLLLVTDADNLASELTYTLVSPPANGSLNKGVLALAANDTFTQAQIDAGLVTYSHDGSETISDSFDFSVSDGAGGSIPTTTFSIVVNPVNDNPVLVNNNPLTVDEGALTQTIGSASLLVSDADNLASELTYTLVSAPTNGSLLRGATTLAANDTFTQQDINDNLLAYSHDGSETTSDSFSFTVSDGAGGSIPETTFSIVVNPVNDNPTLVNNDPLTVDEGALNQTIGNDLLLVSDPDNLASELTYTLISAPTNGSLMRGVTALAANDSFTQQDIDLGILNYSHDGSETISDSFSFTVSDGAGGSIAETTFSIVVNPVNDNPILVNNNPLTVDEGAQDQVIASTALLVTDVDNAASDLVYTLTIAPANGSLENNNAALAANDTFTQADIDAGLLAYSHDGSETTSDSFSFTVSDGAGGSIPETTFSIVINAVNNAPVLVNNNPLTVDEGALNQTIGNDLLLVSDTDNLASELIYSVVSPPANGSLKRGVLILVANDTFTQAQVDAGLVTYSHDGSETTSDSFSFTVSDGAGGSIAETTFSIVVNPVNDAPTLANNGGLTVDEGAQDQVIASTALLVTDVDNAASDLVYTLTIAPANGSLENNNAALAANDTFTQADIDAGLLAYSHDGSETTSDSFSFTVSDGAGGSIPETTFSIVVNPVNDNPTLVNNDPLTVDEGALNQTIGNDLLLVSDADNLASELTYTLVSIPINGSLMRGVTALAANDSFTQQDIDLGILNYSHDGSETISDSFSFTVSDGAGGSIAETTFSIVVNPVNDNPILVNNNPLTVDEGAQDQVIASTALLVTDVDNAASDLVYTLTIAPANGSLENNNAALAANDTFTQADIDAGLLAYSHDGSETTSDSFSFTVSDGAGGSIAETAFSIVVNPVNDAPTLVNNETLTVSEGSQDQVIASTALLVTDVDNAASDLVYTLGSAPANGSLEVNNTALAANDTFTQAQIDAGSLAYSHDGSETASDSFSFTVSDGAGGSIAATTFSITITTVLGSQEAILEIDRADASVTRAPTGAGLRGFTLINGLAFDGSSIFGADAATDQLVRIDPDTGVANAIGHLGASDITGLAFLSSSLRGVDSANQLLTINTTTGAASARLPISGLSAGGALRGLAAQGGALYAIDNVNGNLVALGGDGVVVSETTLTGLPAGAVIAGLAADAGDLVGVDIVNDQLLSIALNGSVTPRGNAGDVPGAAAGLAPSATAGVVYASETEVDRVLQLDVSGGQILGVVGHLGFNDINGLAAGPTSYFGYDAVARRIVRINPSTGAGVALPTALDGALGAGARLTGMAVDPAMVGRLYGVNDAAELFAFDSATAAITTSTPISGLSAGAQLGGLAFDTSTGSLVAIDNANAEIAAIDPDTGAAAVTALTNFPAGARVEGLAYRAASNNFLASDTGNGQLLSINSIGIVAVVGADGLGFDAVRGLAPPIAGATTVAGVDSGVDRLLAVDLGSGRAATTGSLPTFEGLAQDFTNNDLYATLGSRLFRIDTAANAAAFLSDLGAAFPGLAFDATGARLLGVDGAGTLFEIDLATFAASQIGATGAVGLTNVRGLTYDPNADILYGIDTTGGASALLQISTVDGSQSAAALTVTGFADIQGLGYDRQLDILYGVSNDTRQLLTIDPATGAATVIGGQLQSRGLTVR